MTWQGDNDELPIVIESHGSNEEFQSLTASTLSGDEEASTIMLMESNEELQLLDESTALTWSENDGIAEIDNEGEDLELDNNLTECIARYDNELTEKELEIGELQIEKETLIHENTSLMEQNFMLHTFIHEMMQICHISCFWSSIQERKNSVKLSSRKMMLEPVFTQVFLHINCLCVFLS